MRKIRGNILKEIESVFPYIKLEDLRPDLDDGPGENTPLKKEITDKYSFFSISVFDHFLTDEEFRKENVLDFCSGVINSDDLNNIIRYAEHELKFVNFYFRLRQILGDENIFLYKEGRGYYKFLHCNKFYKSIVDHIREESSSKEFERYCLPVLGVLITPGWYFTHHVIANTALYKKDEFEKIVKESGLFILN